MRQRKKQSNRPEYCPVCLRVLSNRAAAVSHYNAHVRAGELIKDKQGYQIAGDWRKVWWERGFRFSGSGKVASVRDRWLNRLLRKRAG